MSTTTYAQRLTPELQFALLEAVVAADPRERGASRARRVQGRMAGVLGAAAGMVALHDAVLLFGA